MGCDGLDLNICHEPHMGLIDLDPQPILGMDLTITKF